MSRWLKLILMVFLMSLGAASARAYEYAGSLPAIAAADLPTEGRELLALIRKGGPFPYARDGTTFSNREGRLPKQPRGYYREYTVKTPAAHDRGARRIICGGKQQLTCYYTRDHYATFSIIKD